MIPTILTTPPAGGRCEDKDREKGGNSIQSSSLGLDLLLPPENASEVGMTISEIQGLEHAKRAIESIPPVAMYC